jgi:polysaccharide export outer membrane protein
MLEYKRFSSYFVFLIGIFVILITVSCGGSKKIGYFADLKDSTVIDSVFFKEVRIKKGDQLSINIASLNQEIDNIINKANTIGAAAISSGESQGGYFVTETGVLHLPRIGRLKVEGMTHAALTDTLQKLYSEYAKDPIVSVRLMNFRVIVLGEVNRPGQITFSTTNVDIFEAIGKAGDLSQYGRREDVLLIRQSDSMRVARRLDLTKADIIGSEMYQLQSGDLIYVEANKVKKNTTSLTFQLWPMVSGSLSLMIALLGLVIRF